MDSWTCYKDLNRIRTFYKKLNQQELRAYIHLIYDNLRDSHNHHCFVTLRKYIEKNPPHKSSPEEIQKYTELVKFIESIPHQAIELYKKFPNVPVHVAKGGTSKTTKKVNVLGRERTVTKEGRKSMITYKGQKLSLSEARALEKDNKKKS